MRLIDADALKESIYGWDVASVKDIDAQPTIDAAPVVRCKDCKFNYANQIPSEDVCQLCVELPITGDFFCKWGEREEGN